MENKPPYEEMIRTRLKAYEAPYEPADWAAMEKKLDKDQGRAFAWWKSGLAIFLMGAATLGIFLHFRSLDPNNNRSDRPHSTASTQSSLQVAGQPKPSLASNEHSQALSGTETSSNQTDAGTNDPLSSNTASTINQNGNTSIYNSPSGNNGFSSSNNNNNHRSSTTNNTHSSNSNPSTHPSNASKASSNTVVKNSIPESPPSSSLVASSNNELALAIASSESQAESAETKAEEKPADPPKSENSPNNSSKTNNKLPKKHSTGLAVSVGGGLESSFLANDKISAPTTKAGVNLSLDLKHHISLQAGLAYETQKYQNNHPEADTFRADYDQPRSYESKLHELSIAVTIQYQFLNAGNNHLGVQSGIAIDYILDESFHYDMGIYGDADSVYNKLTHQWVMVIHDTIAPPTETDFNSPITDPGAAAIQRNDFSVAGKDRLQIQFVLAMAYERMFGKHFSVIAQPELQISTTKVGNQKAPLMSGGLQLYLKYRF